MALDKKKSGFALDVEGRMSRAQSNDGADTDTYTHTATHTYTDTNSVGYPYKKETKSKRLNLLAKPSVYQKLDDYAKEHGDTFNNLVHTLMEEFIDKNNL